MATTTIKATTLAHLELLARKVKNKMDALPLGEDNVLDGVQVNNESLPLANKKVNILIAEGKTNGTISVNNKDVKVTGLADLIAAVNTLKGSSDGSVTDIVNAAIDDFARKMTDDNNTIDTFAEIVNYIANHPDAAQIVTDIDKLEKLVGTLPTGITSTTVVAYIAEAITEALKGYVAKDENKGLSTNDYTTTEKNKLSGIEANATKVEASTTNGKIKINGTETTVYTEPDDVLHGKWATDTDVIAMLESVFVA